MAYRKDWVRYIRQRARRYGIDPMAALAIASAEGLSGAVGDAGSSFGPFQLHVGGALPQGRGRAWAESPAGIDYALRKMAEAGARGLTGKAAIAAGVRNFERPADPESEIARALAMYGKVGGGVAPGAPPASGPQAPSPDARKQLALALIAQSQEGPRGEKPDFMNLIGALRQAHEGAQPMRAQAPRQPGGAAGAALGTASGSLAEAFYDPLGGYDRQGGKLVSTGAIGGHSDHVHLSITDKRAILAAIKQAQAMGLAVRENEAVDHVDPVHTKGSFHYRTFPGSKVGMAIDVSGDQKKMAAFYRWALKQLG